MLPHAARSPCHYQLATRGVPDTTPEPSCLHTVDAGQLQLLHLYFTFLFPSVYLRLLHTVDAGRTLCLLYKAHTMLAITSKNQAAALAAYDCWLQTLEPDPSKECVM